MINLFAPFAEAIVQAKRRQVLLPQDFYARIPAAARARSFTVSGLASLAQITQVLDSLVTSIQGGVTFADWKAQALKNVPDLANLPKGRLETIYRNAMLNAYNAGRYQQMRANPRKKYWLYDGIIDSRTTEVCRALDGKIYPADSQVWQRIHPPNHHNCRSTLIGLTEEQARQRGYRPGTPDVIPTEGQPQEGWAYNPADGLDPAINAAAAAGNAALNRQYVKAVAPARTALTELGRETGAALGTAEGAMRAVLEAMLAAIIAALAGGV